jgi:hypothetical protein
MNLKMPPNQSTVITTRVQLQGYGLTQYQSTKITQGLTPTSKQGRTYIYLVSDVISSIRNYVDYPRVKPSTQQQLTTVLDSLLERLGNVISLPINTTLSSHPEIRELTKQLFKAMSATDKTLIELKATAATINGKYK